MGLFTGKQGGEQIRTAGALGSVGLSFVIAMVLGAWFGRVLDRWLGTGPLFFIVFFFVGLAAGILNVYRTVQMAFPPRTSSPSAPAPPPARPSQGGRGDLDPGDD
jgi:F0F1-type ATP synthase assembly protein I